MVSLYYWGKKNPDFRFWSRMYYGGKGKNNQISDLAF
jgi:hypothetical protein